MEEKEVRKDLKDFRVSHNHITSSTDLYNQLVDFIEDCYKDTYPDDTTWNQMTVYEMIIELVQSAAYEKMYTELLTQQLRHNEQMSSNLLTSIMEVTGLIEEVDPVHKEKKEEMETIKDLLETFKAKNDGKPSPNRDKRKAKFQKPLNEEETY